MTQRRDYDNFTVITANINDLEEKKRFEQELADNMSDTRGLTYIQSQYKDKINLTAIIRWNASFDSITGTDKL